MMPDTTLKIHLTHFKPTRTDCGGTERTENIFMFKFRTQSNCKNIPLLFISNCLRGNRNLCKI